MIGIQKGEDTRQKGVNKYVDWREKRYAKKRFKEEAPLIYRRRVEEDERPMGPKDVMLRSGVIKRWKKWPKRALQHIRVGAKSLPGGHKYRVLKGATKRLLSRHPLLRWTGETLSQTAQRTAVDVGSHELTMRAKIRRDPEYAAKLKQLGQEQELGTGHFRAKTPHKPKPTHEDIMEAAKAKPQAGSAYTKLHPQHTAHTALMLSQDGGKIRTQNAKAAGPIKLNQKTKTNTKKTVVGDDIEDPVINAAARIYEAGKIRMALGAATGNPIIMGRSGAKRAAQGMGLMADIDATDDITENPLVAAPVVAAAGRVALGAGLRAAATRFAAKPIVRTVAKEVGTSMALNAGVNALTRKRRMHASAFERRANLTEIGPAVGILARFGRPVIAAASKFVRSPFVRSTVIDTAAWTAADKGINKASQAIKKARERKLAQAALKGGINV